LRYSVQNIGFSSIFSYRLLLRCPHNRVKNWRDLTAKDSSCILTLCSRLMISGPGADQVKAGFGDRKNWSVQASMWFGDRIRDFGHVNCLSCGSDLLWDKP
jgi:hypothetical protein